MALLAIIPGALIDVLFFGERLVLRQTVGIVVAVAAGWLILGTPSLAELLTLPLWMWLALINACTLAVNQGVTRWIKEVNVWVKNFWGGLATTTLGVLALVLLPAHAGIFPTDLVLWSALAGFVVIGLWSFNILSYRSGASIPSKHVVVSGAYLSAVVLVGYVLFGERILLVQVFGFCCYIVSAVLMSNGVWEHQTRKV